MHGKRINCFDCKHFYTTWDKRFPRGCRAFQFKTKQMPSALVIHSSGQSCMKYEPKHEQKNPKRNNNSLYI